MDRRELGTCAYLALASAPVVGSALLLFLL